MLRRIICHPRIWSVWQVTSGGLEGQPMRQSGTWLRLISTKLAGLNGDEKC
ncbi:hypothetical protein QE369_002194 [Agrobacterium larrymoorei]|uniref:Uncharacterized protein n=1 Tax=Agrobacterium larrymoorei TaxID=160699 RepID=A0AAJ2EV01_9HYPH|nr:hypothetical protein [Agrobacterium larrymoorei]